MRSAGRCSAARSAPSSAGGDRKAGGAAIGAIIGETTGAMIADQGRRNRDGYYAWRRGCYIHRLDGVWVRVHPRCCY